MTVQDIGAAPAQLLGNAVHRHPLLSREGLRERVFTAAFRQLVYAQIWEDPVVDMEAMQLTPDSRVLAIASGGCNVLSYLTAAPAEITAIDLNPAHIALLDLKLAALRYLPGHDGFHRLFGHAADRTNLDAYDRFLRDRLPERARQYWDGRDMFGRRRIAMFADGFHRHGLLGRFIGLGHWLSRMLGADPRVMIDASSRSEQVELYERHLAPLFRHPLLRRLLSSPASLYGLGIPPAQFRALSGGRAMEDVLAERLRRLACDFDLRDNYFAWQAFARRYEQRPEGSVPPYLEKRHFEALRARAGRIKPLQTSLIDHLAAQPDACLDRYVLLDAQDWMDDSTLTRLWSEITRTARPGARVIFRTADVPSLLPGRVPETLLSRWRYDAERSADGHQRDRSAVYGGFHVYRLAEGA